MYVFQIILRKQTIAEIFALFQAMIYHRVIILLVTIIYSLFTLVGIQIQNSSGAITHTCSAILDLLADGPSSKLHQTKILPD